MNHDKPKPIFVIGTGRSGSTVFFEIFARHPNVSWLSKLSRDYPSHLWLNRWLMQMHSFAFFENFVSRRIGPAEAYPFWDLQCPGFSNPCRDLTENDVTPQAANRLRESIGQITTGRRDRFLAKITGWPRVRYLNAIFPNALFIEVKRNACATASSLLQVPFWDGWRGPPNWRRGQLPPDLLKIWQEEDESFIALAAIELVILQRAMEKCRTHLRPNRHLVVHYTDLCANPIDMFRNITDFCQLPRSRHFDAAVRSVRLVDRDDRWKSTLSDSQQQTLLRVLERAGLGLPD